MADSLYDILGVAKTADPDAIRKAYRKLARRHHPDLNPGDAAAEASFKRVSAAYEVLTDPAKRAAYDEFGEASIAGGFDATKARAHAQWQEARQRRATHFGDGPAEFDFADLFGRGGGGRGGRGGDLHATIELDLRQAIAGVETSLELPGHGEIRVRIPPGADDGATIRIAGKGAAGRGGPPGDLVIETRVQPHPHVRRAGLDLYLTLPVTIDEAYNGGKIEVPTFDGTIVLTVPPRAQTGTTLRVRGKGVPRKDARGDLFVVLEVRLPDIADEALAAALRAATSAYSTPVRQGVVL